MPRFWTCRKCGTKNPRAKTLCAARDIGEPSWRCSGRKPKTRVPKHKTILELPYEAWVERFGEQCGICGRLPSANRRLDRDHWHDTKDERAGTPRGLLCWLCNKRLDTRADAAWLRKAADYLDASVTAR